MRAEAIGRRGLGWAGDVLTLAAVVACIPFVILAVGMPLAVVLRLLAWIVGDS